MGKDVVALLQSLRCVPQPRQVPPRREALEKLADAQKISESAKQSRIRRSERPEGRNILVESPYMVPQYKVHVDCPALDAAVHSV